MVAFTQEIDHKYGKSTVTGEKLAGLIEADWRKFFERPSSPYVSPSAVEEFSRETGIPVGRSVKGEAINIPSHEHATPKLDLVPSTRGK